jgi:raffinose/stachyose/melibiose transport system permease protein
MTPGSTRTLHRVLFYLIMSVIAAIWLVPVFFVIFTAVKSEGELARSPIALPRQILWSNFVQAWTEGRLGTYMRNSSFICLVKVPAGLVLNSLAAFALARLRVRFGTGIFVYFLVGMMLPAQMGLIPIVVTLKSIRLMNTLWGLILVYIAYGSSFGIFMLRGFMRTLPRELDEAAVIDGCGPMALYWRVTLPLVKPAMASLVILDFLWTWNEFVFSQILVPVQNLRTVTTGILQFQGEFMYRYTLMNAGMLITIVPVFVVFLFFQKYFVRGLVGSVKG